MRAILSTHGNGITRAVETPGGAWQVERLLDGQPVACLAADPLRPGVVYAGARGGALCSGDGGRTWQPLGLAGQAVKAIAASPLAPGRLYAGTKPACLFISHDYGQRWQEIGSFRKIFSRRFWFSPAEPPFSAYVQAIALSPTDPAVMLVGIEAGAVVRSADGGATWQDHRKGALRDCHSLQFHPAHGEWAYEAGGTGAGFAFSHDGGSAWAQPRTGLEAHYGWACAADPLYPETCFVSVSPSAMKAHGSGSAQAAIYRLDGSGAWQKLGGGLPQPLDHMPYALITRPAEPQCIYAGLSNGDVWRSSDRGESWARLPVNLGSIHRSMLVLEEKG